MNRQQSHTNIEHSTTSNEIHFLKVTKLPVNANTNANVNNTESTNNGQSPKVYSINRTRVLPKKKSMLFPEHKTQLDFSSNPGSSQNTSRLQDPMQTCPLEYSPKFKINDRNFSPNTRQMLKTINAKKIDLDGLTSDQLVELGISILNKHPKMRAPYEIEILYKCTKENAFFKKYDSDTHLKCLKNMYSEHYEPDQVIFEVGSPGTTFYVILKGKVGVKRLVPHTKTNEKGEIIIEKELTEVRVLNAGEAFGELALMKNGGLRAATIYCKEACDLAVLDKAPFKEILDQKEQAKLSSEITFLGSTKLFHNCSYFALQQIYLHSSLTTFHRGSIVYKENDYADSMFVIKFGEFKVTKTLQINENELEDEGDDLSKFLKKPKLTREIEIAILTPGEIFGVEELRAGTKRQNTVICISHTAEAYNIPKEHYETKVLYDPRVSAWIGEHIPARENFRNHRLESIEEQTRKHKNYIMIPSTPMSRREKLIKCSARADTTSDEVKDVMPNIPLMQKLSKNKSVFSSARSPCLISRHQGGGDKALFGSSNSIDNLMSVATQNTEPNFSGSPRKIPPMTSRASKTNTSSHECSKENSPNITPRNSKGKAILTPPKQGLDLSTIPYNSKISPKNLRHSQTSKYIFEIDDPKKPEIYSLVKSQLKRTKIQLNYKKSITKPDFSNLNLYSSTNLTTMNLLNTNISKVDFDSLTMTKLPTNLHHIWNLSTKSKISNHTKDEITSKKSIQINLTNSEEVKINETYQPYNIQDTAVKPSSSAGVKSAELTKHFLKMNEIVDNKPYTNGISSKLAQRMMHEKLHKTLFKNKFNKIGNELILDINKINMETSPKSAGNFFYNRAVLLTPKENDSRKSVNKSNGNKIFMNQQIINKLSQKPKTRLTSHEYMEENYIKHNDVLKEYYANLSISTPSRNIMKNKTQFKKFKNEIIGHHLKKARRIIKSSFTGSRLSDIEKQQELSPTKKAKSSNLSLTTKISTPTKLINDGIPFKPKKP